MSVSHQSFNNLVLSHAKAIKVREILSAHHSVNSTIAQDAETNSMMVEIHSEPNFTTIGASAINESLRDSIISTLKNAGFQFGNADNSVVEHKSTPEGSSITIHLNNLTPSKNMELPLNQAISEVMRIIALDTVQQIYPRCDRNEDTLTVIIDYSIAPSSAVDQLIGLLEKQGIIIEKSAFKHSTLKENKPYMLNVDLSNIQLKKTTLAAGTLFDASDRKKEKEGKDDITGNQSLDDEVLNCAKAEKVKEILELLEEPYNLPGSFNKAAGTFNGKISHPTSYLAAIPLSEKIRTALNQGGFQLLDNESVSVVRHSPTETSYSIDLKKLLVTKNSNLAFDKAKATILFEKINNILKAKNISCAEDSDNNKLYLFFKEEKEKENDINKVVEKELSAIKTILIEHEFTLDEDAVKMEQLSDNPKRFRIDIDPSKVQLKPNSKTLFDADNRNNPKNEGKENRFV